MDIKEEKKKFIDWCFENLSGHDNKYDVGLKVWMEKTLEIEKLLAKIKRLEGKCKKVK